MIQNFQEQETELFNYYLDTDAFPIPENNNVLYINKHGLELIIRPNCNQTCEYCYSYQHGTELYPNNNFTKDTQIYILWSVKCQPQFSCLNIQKITQKCKIFLQLCIPLLQGL